MNILIFNVGKTFELVLIFLFAQLVQYTDPQDPQFDEYATKQIDKRKSSKIDPRELRNGGGASRFANSRCRPPSKKLLLFYIVINKFHLIRIFCCSPLKGSYTNNVNKKKENVPVLDKDGNPVKDEFTDNPFKNAFQYIYMRN